MTRPDLNENISLNDFHDFYWLKQELVDFCRTNEIDTSGGKTEITDRIALFLSTGEVVKSVSKINTISKSDLNTSEINNDTIITDNYKSSEGVRAFMIAQIGPHFRFNVEFVKWIKQNTGKTMKDAIEEWQKIHLLKKDKKNQTQIAPQFEYNTYIRDFLADNPGKAIKDAIRFWKIKREQRGDNKYSKSDLLLKEEE